MCPAKVLYNKHTPKHLRENAVPPKSSQET